MTDDIDPNTRIVIIRRGEQMRIQMPFTQYALDTTSPAELALLAASMFIQLQATTPGRADEPITSKTPQMALFLPFMDNPLEDEPLWAVLAGSWQMMTADVAGTLPDELHKFPFCVLNLKDI